MAIKLGSTDEIPSGERKFYKVEGAEIGVLNIDGEYYGVQTLCPHMGGPLGRGPIDPEKLTISCPFHSWEFSVVDGEHQKGRNKKIRTFDVYAHDGEVYIDM